MRQTKNRFSRYQVDKEQIDQTLDKHGTHGIEIRQTRNRWTRYQKDKEQMDQILNRQGADGINIRQTWNIQNIDIKQTRNREIALRQTRKTDGAGYLIDKDRWTRFIQIDIFMFVAFFQGIRRFLLYRDFDQNKICIFQNRKLSAFEKVTLEITHTLPLTLRQIINIHLE